MKIVNFGSLNIDFTFRVEQFVQPGQTIDSLDVTRSPGGKGLNQTIAIARAGHEVYHAGMIGEDGQFLKALLEKDGVNCRFLKTVEGETGKAFIQVDARGQNCIIINGGANRFNTEAVCDEILNAFDPGDMLLLQNEIACVNYLISKAAERGMIVALNPSPLDKVLLAGPLDQVSILILNEDEAMGMTGKKDPKEMVDALVSQYPDARIILTLGSKGAVYAHRDERITQPVFPVNAVDTTGAGDTFTGYLLANMAQNRPMSECLSRAAKAASIAVTRRGAAVSIPYADEVQASLDSTME